MSGCDSRQPHQSQDKPGTSVRLESPKPAGRGSTRTACHLGSWQTSNAPALQAGPCGSVTRRLHQPSPAASLRAPSSAGQPGTSIALGEGCRAGVPRDEGGRSCLRHAPSCGLAGHFYCGENEIQVSLISSTFVGATPTPATTFREVSRLPGRNPGVTQQAGSDDWTPVHQRLRPTISGPVAQTRGATRCLREGCGCKSHRVRHSPAGDSDQGG